MLAAGVQAGKTRSPSCDFRHLMDDVSLVLRTVFSHIPGQIRTVKDFLDHVVIGCRNGSGEWPICGLSKAPSKEEKKHQHDFIEEYHGII